MNTIIYMITLVVRSLFTANIPDLFNYYLFTFDISTFACINVLCPVLESDMQTYVCIPLPPKVAKFCFYSKRFAMF